MTSETPIAMGALRVVATRTPQPSSSAPEFRHRFSEANPSSSPLKASRDSLESSPPSGSEDRPDSAAPFKRDRRPRNAQKKVSLLSISSLWLAPLIAELLLLAGAAWLTVCLYRVVQEPGVGFPTSSIVLLAAAYLGVALYCRVNELFLPRAVVSVGVGALAVVALVISAAMQIDGYLLGGRARLLDMLLVLTPLHLFLLRCVLSFREARFTPTTSSLARRVTAKSNWAAELRRTIRFWLS